MIKHIFHSYHLNGNKLYDAKCLTPVDGLHIVNKDYVVTSTTFNTTLANQYKTPFAPHDYMGQVHALPVVTVLDRLLYPVLPPTFVEPTLVKFNVSFHDTPIGNGLPQLWDVATNAIVYLTLNHGERTASSVQLIFKKTGNADITKTLNYGATNVQTTTSITMTNVFDSVILRCNYVKISTVKNNTHGVPTSVPQNNNPYTLDVDVTDIILSRCETVIAPYMRVVTDGDVSAAKVTALGSYIKTFQTSTSLYDNTVLDLFLPYDLSKVHVRFIIKETATSTILAVMDAWQFTNMDATNGIYKLYRLNIGSWHDRSTLTVIISPLPLIS
jgi:hypothetical protein